MMRPQLLQKATPREKLSVVPVAIPLIVIVAVMVAVSSVAEARKGRTAAHSSGFPPASTRSLNQSDGPP